MKKLILATLLIGMMGGCTPATVKTESKNYTIPTVDGAKPISTCKIDGCEYFTCETRGGVVITHKGNCSNPIHKGGNK